MYSGLIQDSILNWAVRKRLRAPVDNGNKSEPAEAAVSEEVKGARNHIFESAPLSKTRPEVTVASAVQWQLDYHEGFVGSFVSSIKYASIEGKQESWRKLRHLKDKVIIFAGKTDALM
jgi:hypothetical protein